MGAPWARTVPDPVTKTGSAATVLDFAVGQILRDEVPGDQRRLMQVLDNLIANAVKFSHRNQRVRVTADYDGRQWRMDISDRGIGIPEAEAGRLFSRFVRASNAQRRAAGNRPGPVDRQGADRDARRPRGRGEHAGPGQHVHRLPIGS